MHYAIVSGIFMALGSLFGKLSGLTAFGDFWIIRICCIILMLLSNTCGLRNYIKALHQCNSTITATISSTATNYVTSVVAGTLIFGESTSLLWWTGFTLIIIGLGFIVYDDNETKAKQKLN